MYSHTPNTSVLSSPWRQYFGSVPGGGASAVVQVVGTPLLVHPLLPTGRGEGGGSELTKYALPFVGQ